MRALHLFSCAALFAALSSSGCSSTPNEAEAFGGPGAACKGELQGFCGSACSTDTQCPTGLYCNLEGKCSADCTERLACPQAATCVLERGWCKLDPALQVGVDGGDPGACPAVKVDFAKATPTVLVLVDQSGSMTERFGTDTRWNVARKALIDPTNGVIKTLDGQVRFGIALYTSKDGNKGGTCPMLDQVAIGTGNYAQIAAMYSKAEPIGDTPTGDAIVAVTRQLADPKIPGPKYIVLATDGEPDTCAVPNPQNGQAEAIAAAKAAYAQGITTLYISVGSEVSAKHAQDMANAGQGLPAAAKAKYYVANDPASLAAAFDATIKGVRNCVFSLNAKVTDPAKGEVVLDGAKLGYDDPNGWKLLPGGTAVELQGKACETIKEGDHTLTAQFACDSVIVR
jgi:hypothetical protein